MPEVSPLLRDAVAAIRVRPPCSFSWLGVRVGSPRAAARRGLTEAHLLLDLEERIARTLYASFYCRGSVGPLHPGNEPPRPEEGFVQSLSRANRGGGCVDPGWRCVTRNGSGQVFVKNGIAFTAPRAAAWRGGAAALALPKELPRLAPGFYTALGERSLDARAPIVRIYWNVEAAGAAPLVARVTGLLNERRLPFRFKIANRAAAFDRCDAAVLYARRSDRARLWPLLAAIRRALRSRLGAAVPAFTKSIAPGVAVAEEPAGGESFGMSRCRLLAGALVRAALRESHGPGAALREIDQAFAQHGLDLARPHLNPGSRDVYPPLTP